MLIPTQVFPISKICDPGNSRYALGGVRLERDAEGPVAVTTDGRRLLIVRWQEDDGYPAAPEATATVENFEALIPMKQWDEAGKLPPKKSIKPILCNVLVEEASANGKVKLSATDLETARQITATSLAGKFPRWREVLPDYEGMEVRFTDETDAADACHWLASQEGVALKNSKDRMTACFTYTAPPKPEPVEGEDADDDQEETVDPMAAIFAGLAHQGFRVTYFGPRSITVTIDPEYLVDLMVAMRKINDNEEARGIDLSVPMSGDGPVVAKNYGSSNARVTGVLMPLCRDR